MAIAFIRQAAGTTFGTSRVQAITATTAGNTLILVLLHQATGAVTVADSAGQTWTLAGDTVNATPTAAASQYKIGIYYRLNSASVTSVTATTASSTIAMNVSEWSGVTGFGSVAVKYDASTGTTSGAASVTAAVGDLVISGSAYFKSADGATVAAPFTALTPTGTSTTREASAYSIRSSAGAAAPVWTYDTPGAPNVGTVTAAFSSTVVTKSGSTAGSATWTGSASGKRAPRATATGTNQWTGTATGSTPHKGSSAGSHMWAGQTSGIASRAGNATGLTTWQSTASGITNMSGHANQVFGWSGSAEGFTPTSGHSTGDALWLGDAQGSTTPKAAATGTHQWGSQAAGHTSRRGSATSTLTYTGAAEGTNAHYGETTATGTLQPRQWAGHTWQRNKYGHLDPNRWDGNLA